MLLYPTNSTNMVINPIYYIYYIYDLIEKCVSKPLKKKSSIKNWLW